MPGSAAAYDAADQLGRFCPRLFRQVMMSRQRLAVSLFVAFISTVTLPASGFAQTTVTSERPASFTLPNGLQVVVIPDHRTPVVTEMIWYNVGSADETPGKSGLAHFLEHLMFMGTSKHPAGEFSQFVLRICGNESALPLSARPALTQPPAHRPNDTCG